MINILIVEDDKYIQEHFVKLFTADERFHLVGAVRDAFEAEQLCNKGIDLVLMDVQTLHRHSGLAAGKRIKESCPNTKVVIMTSLVDPEVLSKAKTGCADGLCYKDHGDDEVMAVIERVLNGERSFPDETQPVELEDILSSEIKPIHSAPVYPGHELRGDRAEAGDYRRRCAVAYPRYGQPLRI